LVYIVLTHGHIDHIANLNELRGQRPCRVVATAETSDMLPFPKKNLSAFHPVPSYSAERADVLMNGKCERLPWGRQEMILHALPGHTAGCLTVEMPQMLFTGDILIKGEKTVVKLPGGDREILRESLAWIFTLPEDMRVFAGHGDCFYLREVVPSMALDGAAGAIYAREPGLPYRKDALSS
jgi:glyoxylase-like metal-dependent hydrolase (beta-lactamase superfamily II)